MRKFLISLLFAILIIALSGIFSWLTESLVMKFKTKSLEEKELIEVEREILLSDEEKQSLNYEKLIEDIISVRKTEQVIHAAMDSSTPSNIIPETYDTPSISYTGEGYTIKSVRTFFEYIDYTGIATKYSFLHNEKVIYEVIPKRQITASPIIIFIVAFFIYLLLFILLFKKGSTIFSVFKN